MAFLFLRAFTCNVTSVSMRDCFNTYFKHDAGYNLLLLTGLKGKQEFKMSDNEQNERCCVIYLIIHYLFPYFLIFVMRVADDAGHFPLIIYFFPDLDESGFAAQLFLLSFFCSVKPMCSCFHSSII